MSQQAPSSARRSAWLLLARMALADGTVTVDERNLLRSLAGDETDGLIEEARGADEAALIAGIERYADGFFIALRAGLMARIDGEIDAAEEALYQRMLTAFEITVADQTLMSQTIDGLLTGVEAPDPRIEALYAESSFVVS